MRILVSGGGTGGHISPVLAVLSEVQKLENDAEILYVGSREGLEVKIIPQTGINFLGISSGKFRRYHSNMLLNVIDPTTIVKNVSDLFGFVRGYFEARAAIKEFDPDVVFTKGGYVSLPVGLAAHSFGLPLVIHESDSIMGLSNKMLAKRADKVCVSYPVKYYPEIDKEKLVYSGNPIREDILKGAREKGLNEFGLSGKKPVILVIGGSQGALVINQLVSDGLKKLLSKYEIIHISGERDYDWLQYKASKLPEEIKENYHLSNFLSGNLKDAYAVADLVISRAGNNVISELAALSKPTILIPLASSANNHQVENAKIISRMGAGIMMLQDHLSPEKLARQVDLLMESPDDMKEMGEKLHDLENRDAAKLIASEIQKLGREYAAKFDEEQGEDSQNK